MKLSDLLKNISYESKNLNTDIEIENISKRLKFNIKK